MPEFMHWNHPAVLHEMFVSRAERTPDAIAVVAPDGCLSYRALDEKTNLLARFLRENGVGKDILVGIALERSLDMAVAILGVLKAGGAYVPLDPAYPTERLAYMMKDAGLEIVLTQEHFVADLPQGSTRLFCLDRDWAEIAKFASAPLEDKTDPRDLAYCIYTSGSTGTPKGTLVSHEAIYNTLQWLVTYAGLNEDDRIIAVASFSFDASIWEFWPAFFVGGRTILSSPHASRDPAVLYRELAENQVTVMTSVPSLLAVLLEKPDLAALASLRHVFSAGEMLPRSTRDKFYQHCSAQLHNAYGPTETAVCATCGPCRRDDPPSNINIGRPIANVSIHILDEALQPLAAGQIGELCIGGPGLARGYLGRPELTAERFVPDPFGPPNARLYRTGDLACWRDDGTLEYVGRTDRQVKINGIRVELGEIEAALSKFPSVATAAVTVQQGTHNQVVAYVVAREAAVDDTLSPVDIASRINDDRVRLFDNTYDTPRTDPTFVGWNDSYTGAPIPLEAVEEWRQHTVDRIMAYAPKRVLELGCGSGLILEKVAPQVEYYRATDISSRAMANLSAWIASKPDLANVSLSAQEANDFRDIEDKTFDIVILNSVAMYFPNIAYLKSVLDKAKKVLRPSGRIFVGDVRSAPLLTLFHTSVQEARAVPALQLDRLAARIAHAAEQDDELVIDPGFFHALVDIGDFASAEMQLKEANFDTELSRYRYDAVLSLAEPADATPAEIVTWCEREMDSRALDRLLATRRPARLRVTDVQNLRVARDLALRDLLSADPSTTVAEMRARLPDKLVGEEPNLYWRIAAAHGYAAKIGWASGSSAGSFDVELKDLYDGAVTLPATPSPECPTQKMERDWEIFGNNPALARLKRELPSWLRDRLKATLPKHMLPARIVVLDQMPLTVNGKVDANELARRSLTVAPTDQAAVDMTPLEARIVRLMADILEVDSFGPNSNFFDVGGHSLLVLKLAAAIETEFGRPIPPAAIFKAPTATELARLIDSTANDASLRYLTRLNQGGVGSPLFCLHGFKGTVDDYLHFARELDAELPVYGIRLGSLDDSASAQDDTIDSLVAQFEEEIHSVQAKGPYRICGYSFGGIPAFKLAQRLSSGGEDVTLILLDAYPLSPSLKMMTWYPRFIKMVQARDVINTARRKLYNLLRFDLYYLLTGQDRDLTHALFRRALRSTYSPFSGRTILIKTSGQDDLRSWRLTLDGANGWKKHLIGALEVVEFNVGHVGLMKMPTVSLVATQLKTMLGNG